MLLDFYTVKNNKSQNDKLFPIETDKTHSDIKSLCRLGSSWKSWHLIVVAATAIAVAASTAATATAMMMAVAAAVPTVFAAVAVAVAAASVAVKKPAACTAVENSPTR